MRNIDLREGVSIWSCLGSCIPGMSKVKHAHFGTRFLIIPAIVEDRYCVANHILDEFISPSSIASSTEQSPRNFVVRSKPIIYNLPSAAEPGVHAGAR
jgi:hypothetical protein